MALNLKVRGSSPRTGFFCSLRRGLRNSAALAMQQPSRLVHESQPNHQLYVDSISLSNTTCRTSSMSNLKLVSHTTKVSSPLEIRNLHSFDFREILGNQEIPIG